MDTHDFTVPAQRAVGTQDAMIRLPRFWGVVRRRWPVLVILPLLALGLAAYNYKHAAKAYTASGEVTLTSLAPNPGNPQGYCDYYNILTSEASSDDLVRII